MNDTVAIQDLVGDRLVICCIYYDKQKVLHCSTEHKKVTFDLHFPRLIN